MPSCENSLRSWACFKKSGEFSATSPVTALSLSGNVQGRNRQRNCSIRVDKLYGVRRISGYVSPDGAMGVTMISPSGNAPGWNSQRCV